MAGERDPSQPRLPVFFDECEKHGRMEIKIDRIESQGHETLKSVLQGQRDTHTRFGDMERKMDSNHERTTGEIAGLREAVTKALLAKAHTNGIVQGRAEMTGEIEVKVRSWGKIAKWVIGAIVALAAGGGATEGIRRLLSGG